MTNAHQNAVMLPGLPEYGFGSPQWENLFV